MTRLPFALLLLLAIFLAPLYAEDRTDAPQPKDIPLPDPLLRESSGLAASGRDPKILWTHNDSGDAAHPPRSHAPVSI